MDQKFLTAMPVISAVAAISFLTSQMQVATAQHSPSAQENERAKTDQDNTAKSRNRLTGTITASDASVAFVINKLSDDKNTQENGYNYDWRDWLFKFITEVKITDVVIAVFTAFLWWSTRKLWQETKSLAVAAKGQSDDMKMSLRISKQAADAAREGVNVARETMIITRRPWIRADAAIAGPLFFDNNGLNTIIGVRLLNVGPTPAIYTSVNIKFYILMRSDYGHPGGQHTKSGGDMLAAQKIFSDENMGETLHNRGDTVFPFIPDEGPYPIFEPEFRIPANGDLSGVSFADEPFLVFILGSVSYKFAFHEDVHRTGFIYRVNVTDPSVGMITPRVGRIPMEKLSLIKIDDGYTD